MFKSKYKLSSAVVKEIMNYANEPIIKDSYASFIEKIKKLNFGHLMAMFKHIERKIEDLEDARNNYFEEMANLDKNAKVPTYPKETENISELKVQKALICKEMSHRMLEKYQVDKDEQTF